MSKLTTQWGRKMTEDEAWDELERRQSKKPQAMTERKAMQIAYNALVEIDKQTPYPIAKHAIKCLNEAFNSQITGRTD